MTDTIKLKRKKEYPDDICAAAGCRRKKGLVFYDIPKGKGVVRVPICPGCSEGLSLAPADWAGVEATGELEGEEDPKESQDGPIRAFKFDDLAQLSMRELPGVRVQWAPSPDEVEMLVGTGLGLKRPEPPANQQHFEICWLSDHQKHHYRDGVTTADEMAALFESVIVVDDPPPEPEKQMTVQDAASSEHAEAKEALALVEHIDVTSAEEEQSVALLISEIKEKNKTIEEMKQRALRPLRASIKEITEWFRPVQSAYAEMERELKSKVLDYRSQLEAERVRALQEMQESETVEEAREAKEKLVKAQTPETKGIRVSKVWDYEIVDIAQLANFDPGLVQPNKGAIRKLINKGEREVPGLRVFQKEVASSV